MSTLNPMYLFLILTVSLCKAQNLLDRVVLMGDSDIFYWDERGTNFPGATNLGTVGAFCSTLSNQLEDAITQYNPTLLILRCGSNDMTPLGGGTPPAEAANRLIEIVETAFSLTDAPIISFGPKPEPPLVQAGFEGRYQEFSDTVIDWSKDQTPTGSSGHVQFTYVDSVEPFLEIGYPNNLFHTDDIHLSTEGYALWDLWLNTAYDAIASGGSPVNCAAWSGDVCIATIEGGEMGTSFPTFMPSHAPTSLPTLSPSHITENGSSNPTSNNMNTSIPTFMPSHAPTSLPTLPPSHIIENGSSNPTSNNMDTSIPTFMPSHAPTSFPTLPPSHVTANGSSNPTSISSHTPTLLPTYSPSLSPSSIIDAPFTAPSVPTPTMTPVMSPVMSGAAIFKPVLLLSSLIPLSLFFSF